MAKSKWRNLAISKMFVSFRENKRGENYKDFTETSLGKQKQRKFQNSWDFLWFFKDLLDLYCRRIY